jgi:hypothetical protein
MSTTHQTPIHFYAKGLNDQGKIEQILVTKQSGKPTVPQWTGHIYRNDREADRDITALNVAIAAARRS